jgi:hypothetical protein
MIIVIPYQELREEDLQAGVRVWVQWDPGDSKPEAVGKIVDTRVWKKEFYLPGEADHDLIIRLLDEQSGITREASLADQWIDIIAPE